MSKRQLQSQIDEETQRIQLQIIENNRLVKKVTYDNQESFYIGNILTQKIAPPLIDVYMRQWLNPIYKNVVVNKIEEGSSAKKKKKHFFGRKTPNRLSIQGDFNPLQVELSEVQVLDTNNGVEEKVRLKKEQERQKQFEEKRVEEEQLKVQQDAQNELMKQLEAIKGKRFTFDQNGNILLQDSLNMNKIPNPLQNIKVQSMNETVRLGNRFSKIEKNEGPKIKTPTIRDMLQTMPIVFNRPQPAPGGSFFDQINPSIGTKIQEGKRIKESDEKYEKVVGKTSRASYLEKQERVGMFQSSMKDKYQNKNDPNQSYRKYNLGFVEKISDRGEQEQSSLALDLKKSKGRIYFKKPQALNELLTQQMSRTQKLKGGSQTHREMACSDLESNYQLTMDQNTDPVRISKMNQMIINCEKWGSSSGALIIESAFHLKSKKNQKHNDDNASSYHPLTARLSSRETPRSSYMTKRVKRIQMNNNNLDQLAAKQSHEQALFTPESSRTYFKFEDIRQEQSINNNNNKAPGTKKFTKEIIIT
ncbi:UNKNOWN [Stylonychia lemnae]|uniref:Uncharacterized protein n=1 Tax=Stylonychia lemnae TaxID=5949 RepID=A0A078A0C8_STYLE|nr:UNKNOWN [Stylonychia lemnae]|eukprot:CDW74238.1 UNKNOWN [Stylonychia lemnae]